MIADTQEMHAPIVDVRNEIPLLTPGHTFKIDGREMIVVQPAEGGEVMYVEVIRSIPADLIDAHPKNRTWCEPAAMAELTESIREHGQSSPGILRPHPDKPGRYQLIAGWRRSMACAGLKRPLQAVVRDLDDVQALEQLYLENAQRENLRPLDEAELIDGMLELRDAQDHRLFTLERVALARYGSAKAGDVARVAKVHKLRLLPEVLRGPVNDGTVPLRVAFLVARIADPVDREKAGGEVLKDPYTYGDDRPPMTVKRATEHIAKNYQVNLKGWAHLERTDLLNEDQRLAMGFTGAAGESGDGSCANCPYLAKNSPLFFDALASGSKKGSGESGIDPNTCTRASCHRSKLDAVWRLLAVEFAAAKGLPAESVLGLEESQAQRNDLAYLDRKPNGYQLGDWQKARDPKNPTWEKILKGSGAEIKVAADDKGEPVLACEKQLAITVGRGKHADLFAKAPVAGDESLSRSDVQALRAKREAGEITADELTQLEAIEAEEEQDRIDERKRQMDRAVEKEARVKQAQELLEKLTEKGPGLASAHAMVLAVCREHGYDFLAFLTQREQEELEEGYDNNYDIEEGLTKHLKGRTVNELLAIAAVAAVWDDVDFSGHERAADFQAMCQAVKVDTKAIFDRVKKAHKLAFKASEKARAESIKAEQGGGKKAGKNSSNPTDWSSDKEASKTAAADAIDRAAVIPAVKVAGGEPTAPASAEAAPAEDVLVDYDQVDVAAAGMALKAGTGEMADFIGKKPVKQKEPERFARWDALRAKILRKAGLKK